MKLSTETIGAGPDLVLLHGWGMNAAVWSPLVESLKQRFRVTLIEMPGHGGSDYAPEMQRFEDWVDSCLEAAPESAIWIGWSLGGLLAQRAAMKAPGRVNRLAVVTSTPRFVKEVPGNMLWRGECSGSLPRRW